MNWGLLGQIAVCWLAVGFIASPYIGRWLRRRRYQVRSAECDRLQKLVELADEHDAATTTAEKKAIYRRAEALGFVVAEQDKVWEGPFMLDENEQPHPKDAA